MVLLMDVAELKKQASSTGEPPDLGAIKGLEVLFQQEESNNDVYLKEHANGIYLVLMNALKCTEKNVIQETLMVLGQGLHSEIWINCLSEKQCDALITELCDIIEASTEKAVCSRAIWCFYCQMFRNVTLSRHLKYILTSIAKCVLESKFISSSLQFEAVRVIKRFLGTVPLEVSTHSDIWWKIISSNLVHRTLRVRLAALEVVDDFQAILCQNLNIVNHFVRDVKENIVPKMMQLLTEKEHIYVLHAWKSVVRFFGKQVLHQGSSLINCLLEVIQKAFTATLEDVTIAAFECWQELIDNFAIDLDAICNVKRLRLLLQPLHSHTAKTEAAVKAKVLCWWHLICALDCNIQHHYELVFEPIVKLCFGSQRFKNRNTLCLTTIKGVRNESFLSLTSGALKISACNDLPGPLDLVLASYGLQVLGRLFEASYGVIPQVSSSLCLNALRCPVISSSSMFLKCSSCILCAVEISSCVPWSDCKDKSLLLYIWQCLTGRVKMLSNATNENDGNQKETTKFISLYFCVLERAVNEKQLDWHLTLEILETVSSLPAGLLSSSLFSLTGSNPLNGTPSLFLLKLLFSSRLIEEAGSQKVFHQIFTRLSTFSTISTPCFLSCIQSAVEIIDRNASCLKMDLSFKFWTILTTQLIENIEQNQDVNQGDSFEHDFSCVYAILIFPFKHLFVEEITLIMKRSIWKKWDKLYELFTRCAAFVVNIKSNLWCYELASKIRMIVQGKVQSAEFEDLLHLVDTLLKSLQWSGVTSSCTVVGKTALVNGGKSKIDDYFSLSPVIRLIIMIMDAFFDDCNLPRDLGTGCNLGTAEGLIGIIWRVLEKLKNENLVNAVILFATNLAHIFEMSSTPNSVFEESSILTQIDELWSKLTKLLPVNYKGNYNSNFLKDISPLLEATLNHKRRSVRISSRLFWQATFASSYNKLTLPPLLREVLLQIKPLIESENLSPEGGTLLCSPVSEKATIQEDDLGHSRRINGSSKAFCNFLSECTSASKKLCSPVKVTLTKLHTPRSKTKNVDDMDSQDFVVVSTTTKAKRSLTEHQKEVACRRSLIPAMYVDLSQDSSPFICESLDDKEMQTSTCVPVRQDTNELEFQSKLSSIKEKSDALGIRVPLERDSSHLVDAGREREVTYSTEEVVLSSESSLEICTDDNWNKNSGEGVMATSKKPKNLGDLADANCCGSKILKDDERSIDQVNLHRPVVEINKLSNEEIGNVNFVSSEENCPNVGKFDLFSQKVRDDDCVALDSQIVDQNNVTTVAETLEFSNDVAVVDGDLNGPVSNKCSNGVTSEDLLEEIGYSHFVEVDIQSSSPSTNVVTSSERHQSESCKTQNLDESECSVSSSFGVSTRSQRRKSAKIPVTRASQQKAKKKCVGVNKPQPKKKLSELDVVMLIKARRRSLRSNGSYGSVETSPVSKSVFPKSDELSTDTDSSALQPDDNRVLLNASTKGDSVHCSTLVVRSDDDCGGEVTVMCDENVMVMPETISEMGSVVCTPKTLSNCTGSQMDCVCEGVPYDTGPSNLETLKSICGSAAVEASNNCQNDHCSGTTEGSRKSNDCSVYDILDMPLGVAIPDSFSCPVSPNKIDGLPSPTKSVPNSCSFPLSPSQCDDHLSPTNKHKTRRKSLDLSLGVTSRAALILKLAQNANVLDCAKQDVCFSKHTYEDAANSTIRCESPSEKVSRVANTCSDSDNHADVMSGINNKEVSSSSLKNICSVDSSSLVNSILSKSLLLVGSPCGQIESPSSGSPSVSPSGILKKRKSELDYSGCTPNKRKVSFADPPVQGEFSCRGVNQKAEKDISWRLCMSPEAVSPSRTLDQVSFSDEESSQSQMCCTDSLSMAFTQSCYESPLMNDLDSKTCICPELVSCKDSVDLIIHHLTTSTWSRGLGKLLSSKDIKTIGDLSSLSERDIHCLPIKSPKGKVVRQALMQHWKTLKNDSSEGTSEQSNGGRAVIPAEAFVSLDAHTLKKLDDDDDAEAMPSLEDALAQFSPVKMTIESITTSPSKDVSVESVKGVASHVSIKALPELSSITQSVEALNCHPLCGLLKTIDSLEKLAPPDRKKVPVHQTMTMFASAFQRLGELCLNWTKED